MVERYHVPMSHGMMVAQIVSAFCGYFSARRITRQRLAMSVNVFGDTLDSLQDRLHERSSNRYHCCAGDIYLHQLGPSFWITVLTSMTPSPLTKSISRFRLST